MPEFLLEVGCEELPAPWLSGLTDDLGRSFEALLAREGLEPQGVRALSTPRRLVVAGRVRRRQADREERVWGPSLSVARDAAGGWTKAAEGFARKNGVDPYALVQAAKDPADPDQLHLLFVRKRAGRPAREVLGETLPSLLRSLSFPKRMSWDAWLDDGKGSFPFGRPIRWLVAVLDGAVVPFVIHEMRDGARGRPVVTSSDETRGHRFLPRGRVGAAIRVSGLESLLSRLRQAAVLLDPAEREAVIRKGLEAAGSPEAARHPLAAEWRDLVEHPTVLLGRIPDEFQGLPVEVLQTVLVHHQKYIPVLSAGRATGFAAVINTDAAAGEAIVRGMERVVVARLRDAAFFYREDAKRSLAERVPELAGVTFHRRLGSYHDKAERMVRLVNAMGERLGLLAGSELAEAREAARLAKADLTTLMVREFPELQGTMGGIYLRARGDAPPPVASAVEWHYHPVSVEEGSPPAQALTGSAATVFAAVSLADKLDTLVGYFGIGEDPTGSRDPYGLRRAGQGVVRVLLDFWNAQGAGTRPDLRHLVGQAIAGYGGTLEADPPELQGRLEAFLLDRLEYVLTTRGFARDEVDAVLRTPRAAALGDVRDGLLRLQALARVRSEAPEDFEHLAVAFKRASNILKDVEPGAVDPALFESPAESELSAAVLRLESQAGGYEERLRALTALKAPVDRFFDDVLVMAEDPAVRANRLGLLDRARELFYRIADISRLGG